MMMKKYHMRHEYSSLMPRCLDEFRPLSSTFIETGTNIGCGIEAALDAGFKRVVSIEQDPVLYAEVLERFRDNPCVTLWCGDSGAMLRELLTRMTERCVIYLDAHSIEANPLLEELDAIALSACKNHVVLIDDVRMFGTADWHHLMQDEALRRLHAINPLYQISYRHTAHAPNDLMVALI